MARATPLPALVPAPRSVTWASGAPWVLRTHAVAIVFGRRATAPEKEAARLLRSYVARRFGRTWPIVQAGHETAAEQTLLVLGQRSTCRRVDALCREHHLALGPDDPGPNGYIIDAFAAGRRRWVMVAGCDAQGVEYGQDTLTQMLRLQQGHVAFVRGRVVDAPAVRWRGRPQPNYKVYLRPGTFPLLVRSRVNFIDLRSGIYAFPPGQKLDKPAIAQVIRRAHRCGIIVYATVDCGVPAREYPAALGTFRQLLLLGADGLWMSFDDKGPGQDPLRLAHEVLALGRRHQISGHLIAVTPPKGSYTHVDTAFDRKLMAVPGMDRALWFWTAVPSPEILAEARAIGLQAKPGWWHNWPRIFTPHAYIGIPPLSLGWSQPRLAQLRDVGSEARAVMPWGGDAWGQHYVTPAIMWWAWNPHACRWTAVRRRIYQTVFGAGQAGTAEQFDDDLNQLFALFRFSYKSTAELPFCPPRLRRPTDAAQADTLVASMAALLHTLALQAPRHTTLPEARLRSAYLDPMRRELQTLRAASGLTFPEDWWPAVQRRILDALYSGNNAMVAHLIAGARPRVLTEIRQIGRALPTYPHLRSYLVWWRKRAGLDVAGWRRLIRSRTSDLAARIKVYDHRADQAVMLRGLQSPPLQWGIGRWQVSNRLLATVLPGPAEWFWGDWEAGRLRQSGVQAAVFAAQRKKPGERGEYAELHATIPITGPHRHLALLLFVSSANKDLFSDTFVPDRWAGYRYLDVCWRNHLLWRADLGAIPLRGVWHLVRLPALSPRITHLTIRLRATDHKLSLNDYTIAYVGPIRLLELPH